jgi:hypothetical protein
MLLTWLSARSANLDGAMVPKPAEPRTLIVAPVNISVFLLSSVSDRKHLANVKAPMLV